MRTAFSSGMLRALIINLFFTAAVAAQTQTNLPTPAGSGSFGEKVFALPNGNFVVTDSLYDAPGAIADVGAVRLYDGASGALISTLTGSQANDRVGAFEIQILPDGNFVVMSPYWSNGANAEAGAATLCSGASGCSGTVSPANSLVGTNANDRVSVGGIVALTTGKYVVISYDWNGGAGAVTLCAANGCTGEVTTSNSLHGSGSSDQVGFYQTLALPNGNYVVSSIFYGDLENGAVTLCDGATGCVGAVSAANSLIGATIFDAVGSGGITVLTGGDFVVATPDWHVDEFTQPQGAVTRCSGTTGCPATISAANSLLGTTPNDRIGNIGAVALTDGNYIVRSSFWNNSRGAATWCSGTSACTGQISAANSIVGSAANSEVSSGAVRALPGGRYVVSSPNWDGAFANVGAVTFCANPAGCTGTISAANSLLGSKANDNVGSANVMILTSGDYVVGSPNWDNGAIIDVGASTFCSGTSGCLGFVSTANSLVGTTAADNVGNGGAALTNGNYVVRSPNWDGAFTNVGAATFCSAAGGCAGMTVSAANSLVGSKTNDNVAIGGIFTLPNGNYVVRSGNWDNAAIVNAGALTYGNGTIGTVGAITASNSVFGTIANGGSSQTFAYDAVNNQLIAGRPAENIVTLFEPLAPTAASVIVAGRVLHGKRGVARATVTLTDANGAVRRVTTNPLGYYRFAEVSAGETYVFNISAKSYTFAPQMITVTEDLTDLNFTAQTDSIQNLLQ